MSTLVIITLLVLNLLKLLIKKIIYLYSNFRRVKNWKIYYFEIEWTFHLVFTQFSYTMSEWKILNIQLIIVNFEIFNRLIQVDWTCVTIWWRNTMCIIVYYQSLNSNFLYFFSSCYYEYIKDQTRSGFKYYDLNTDKGIYARD